MQRKLKKLLETVSVDLTYNDTAKKAFRQAAHAVLKQIAKDLALSTGQFTIRYNEGGIAAAGDMILHADGLYINFSQTLTTTAYGYAFMFRACRGQKDYTGLQNQWMTYHKLAFEYPKTLEALREALNRGLNTQKKST